MRLIFWVAVIAAVWWWLDKSKPRARRAGSSAGIATSGLIAVLETGGRALEGVIDRIAGRRIEPVGVGTTVTGHIVNPSASRRTQPYVAVMDPGTYRARPIEIVAPPPSAWLREVAPNKTTSMIVAQQ